MKTQKTKLIGMTLVIIAVASVLVCAGIIGYYGYVSENSNNDSFCEDIPAITQEELDAGWYYGFIEQKKPRTPDTWIHILEGTRSARWVDPTTLAEKSGIITAQQFSEDVETYIFNGTMIINYRSFLENDVVVIQGTINEIRYVNEIQIEGYTHDADFTEVKFKVEGFKVFNKTLDYLTFDFRGNITEKFDVGDTVYITFHITNAHIYCEAGREVIFEYHLEIAQEYEPDPKYPYNSHPTHEWRIISSEYLTENFPPERLPQSCISHTL